MQGFISLPLLLLLALGAAHPASQDAAGLAHNNTSQSTSSFPSPTPTSQLPKAAVTPLEDLDPPSELQGATDITSLVEALYDDTRLFHNLSQAHVEAVEICKSYAFDTSQINYHIAGVDDWLRDYVLTRGHGEHYRKHGLMATIAFEYLGISNFECAVGTQHLCKIDCPTVVSAISDLETARRVYFALASASNLLTAVSIVHDGMLAAQVNIGQMASRMAYDYFHTYVSASERHREQVWSLFVSVCIWSAQQVFNSITPLIPWPMMQDYFIRQLSKATGRPVYDVKNPTIFRVEDLGSVGFRMWKGETLARAMHEFTKPGDDEYGLGTYSIAPKGSGPPERNQLGVTLADWMNSNSLIGKRWQDWAYKDASPPAYPATGDSDTRGWSRDFESSISPDFRRRDSATWRRAVEQAARDAGVPTQGSATYSDGRWWWIKNSRKVTDGHEAKRSTPEPQLVSLGPMEAWDPEDQWKREFGPSTDGFLLDVLTRCIAEVFYDDKYPRVKSLHELSRKLEKARSSLRILIPISNTFLVPTILREGLGAITWRGTETGKENNAANLEYVIQQSARHSRYIIREKIKSLFGGAAMGPDGSTELTNVLALGSFLPVDRSSLGSWTQPTVEESLTRNIFFKTLNQAYRSQKIYITCTDRYLHRNRPHSMLSKTKSVEYCEHDNTGPQDLKHCLPSLKKVCYLYKWNDRGFYPAHHNEVPFGIDAFGADPWNLRLSDIITSSVLSASTGLNDLDIIGNTSSLAVGPTPEFITDPTAPGVFTIPICFSHVSWNGPIAGYSLKDDMNVYSLRKVLPCYCGDLGKDTKRVWRQLGFASSPAARKEYRRHLCPRMLSIFVKNELERYIALCRLGVRRRIAGMIVKNGEDSMCDVLISELEKRDVRKIEQVPKEVQKVLRCKIERRWWVRDCRAVIDTPLANAWQEAESVGKTKAPQSKKGRPASTKSGGQAKGKGKGKGKGKSKSKSKSNGEEYTLDNNWDRNWRD